MQESSPMYETWLKKGNDILLQTYQNMKIQLNEKQVIRLLMWKASKKATD